MAFSSESSLLKNQQAMEYVDYWRARWRRNPLYKMQCWGSKQKFVSDEDLNETEMMLAMKFDWQRFVEIAELAVKISRQRKIREAREIPIRYPPNEIRKREVYTSRGKSIQIDVPYQSFMERGQKPEELFLRITDLTGPADKTFTYGQFEFAKNVTQRVWRSKCVYKKVKDNWQYVITPICYEFLTSLQMLLTVECTPGLKRENSVDEDLQREEGESEAERYVPPEIVEELVENKVQNIRFAEEMETIEEVEEIEEMMEVDEVEQQQAEESFEALKEEYRPAAIEHSGFPLEWYPRVVRTRFRHHRSCKDPFTYVIEPIFSPEELTRTFFDDLPRVFRRIGRDDLSIKCCVPVHDDVWMKIKRTKSQRKWVAQGLTRKDPRTRATRMLCDIRNKLERHADKMLVLCHYGRFSYLTTYDMALFARQKSVISNVIINEWITVMATMKEIFPQYYTEAPDNMPQNYVDQSQWALRSVGKAIEESTCQTICKAYENVKLMVTDWRENSFDVARTRNWVPQSDNAPPPLKSSAPSTGASTSVTGGETIDKPITSGEKHINITMVDQREMETGAAKETKSKVPQEAAIVKEIQLSIAEAVKRPQMVSRFQWTSSDAANKELAAFPIPQVYFSGSTVPKVVCQSLNAAYQLAMFGSTRFNMKVRVQVNSVKFQQGRLIMYYVPFYYSDRGVGGLYNNCTQWQHVFIDASTSNPVEMPLDYYNVRDVLPIYNDPHAELAYYGTLHLNVWNTLQTGDTSSKETTVTVWMWLEDLQLYQYCNPKTPDSVHFAKEPRWVGPKGKLEAVKELHPSVSRTSSVRVWEPQAEAIIESGAEIVENIGAQLIETLLNKLVKGSNSKPNAVLPPQPVYPMVAPNLSHGEGLDLTTSLTLQPISCTAPTPYFGRQENLRDLMKKWSRIRTWSWSVDDEVNKSLDMISVMPMVDVDAGKNQYMEDWWMETVAVESGVCVPETERVPQVYWHDRMGCMLDYLSRMFQYWHGSIKYKVEAVCTSMHSGRLVIRYEPYGSKDSAKEECQKLATPGIVWDLQEQPTLEWEAPFASCQQLLHAQYVSNGTPAQAHLYNCSNGIFEVTVMNKLVATTGISRKIDVNLYIAAGDDFEFFVPSPLDGVMSIRYINVPENTKVGEKLRDEQQLMFDDLFEYMITPTKNNWADTVMYSKNGPRVAVQDFTTAQGPLARRQASVALTYLDFVDNVWECLKNVIVFRESSGRTGKEYDIPLFTEITEAHDWLSSMPRCWPTKFIVALPGTFLSQDDDTYDRLMWWLGIATMKLHAWKVEAMPSVRPNSSVARGDILGVLMPITEREWVAQANDSARGPAINPFTAFKQQMKSTKELYGEDHMDMYALMKRWSPWKTATIPDVINTADDRDNTDFIKKIYGPILSEISHMSQFETENYLWEFKIPVTPMLNWHMPGQIWHGFREQKDLDTCRVTKTLKTLKSNVTGFNVSRESNLIWQRYLGELFTFWKGRLRWLIQLHDAEAQTDGKGWNLTVVYNSRNFTPVSYGANNYVLTTRSRMRDAMKQGTVLLNGNIMSTVGVETPYYSKYSMLHCSDAIYDETTCNGTLSIFVPLKVSGGASCEGGNIDYKTLNLTGCRMTIWQAIGDDFEFLQSRAAPTQHLYQSYYVREPTLNDVWKGWDTFSFGLKEDAFVPRPLGTVDKQVGPDPTTKPYLGIGKFYSTRQSFKNRDSINFTKESKDTISKIRDFSWYYTTKLPGETERKWEAQADEVDMVDPISQPTVVHPPAEVTIQTAVNDEIDGLFATVIEKVSKSADAIVAASQGFQKFADVAEKVTPMMETIQRAAAAVEESVPSTADQVRESMFTVNKAGTWCMNTARAGIFFHGMYQALKAETWTERWIPIAQCALALGLSPDVVASAGQWLLGKISEIVCPSKVHEDSKTETNNQEAQAWEDVWDQSWTAFLDEHSDKLRLIAAAIVTITAFYCTPKAPITQKVAGFASTMVHKLRNFAFVGAGIKTLDWMFKWLADVIKTSVVTVGDWVSGGLVTARRMQSHYPEVLEWLKKIERYDAAESIRNAVAWDYQAREDLWKTMDQGTALLSKLGSKTGSLYSYLARGMMRLEKVNQESLQIKDTLPFRIDPYHVSLYGSPGVGKSSVLQFLLDYVMDSLGMPKYNRYYSRSESDDYWSNYTGQTAVIIDDFYQDVDGTAIKEIIKLKTNLAYQVNMARIEEKGRMFTSKIIGSTTNSPFPAPQKLTCAKAVWRRRNALIRVRSVGVIGAEKQKLDNLRFDIVKPCPNEGKEEILHAGMKITEIMVWLKKEIEEWMKLQNRLVFASLQGKVVTVPDYGNVETNDEPQDHWKMMVNSIVGNVKVNKPYWDIIMNESLPWAKWVTTFRHPRVLATMKDEPWFRLWHSTMELAIEATEDLESLYRAWGEVTDHQERMTHILEKHKQFLKWNEEEKKFEMTIGEWSLPYDNAITKSGDGSWIVRAAQVDIDDLFSDTVETREMVDRMNAEEALHQYKEKSAFFDVAVDMLKEIPTTSIKINMADEAEMTSFVNQNYPHLTPEERKEHVTKFSRAYNLAVKLKDQKKEIARLDNFMSQCKQLFSQKIIKSPKYWKQHENGDLEWVLDPQTEEDEALHALYSMLEDELPEDKIKEMYEMAKNEQPEEYKALKWAEQARAYIKRQTDRWQDFLKKHPMFTKLIKIALALGGVLLGYKMLEWLVPGILEKIKAALWAVFGWGTAKIGAERIDYLKGKKEKLVEMTKDRWNRLYGGIADMMRLSKDATVRERAEDPEEVELFAEAMVRMSSQVGKAVDMVKKAEGKTRINAYMIGNSTRVQEAQLQKREQLAEAAKRSVPEVKIPEGCDDQQMLDMMRYIIPKHIVRVAWQSETKYSSLNGIFIKSTILLVPWHLFADCEPGTPIAITPMSRITWCDYFDPTRCVKSKDQDFCLYRCRPAAGMFKDITKHFFSINDHCTQTSARLCLITPDLQLLAQRVTAQLVTDIDYQTPSGAEMRNQLGWEYEADTGKGDCGAVLVAENSKLTRKLLGIHVAGSLGSSFGSSTLIVKEELAEMSKLLEIEEEKLIVTNVIPSDLLDIEKCKIVPQGNFEVHGAVTLRKEVQLPFKTEIQKSAIHDLVREHVTEPSVLTPNDPRMDEPTSPLLKAIVKYGKPTIPFNERDLDYITEHITNQILKWPLKYMEARLLTDYEAVFGNELIEYCDRMNLGASPGYPYTLRKPSGEKGKSWLYDAAAEDGIHDEAYRDTYQQREVLAKAGMRIQSIWTDCLKDERRPLAKIRAGKTRAFMLPPADFVQLCRKYFMAFSVCFYSMNAKTWTAVGVDPYSYDWTLIARYLKKNSNLTFGGDFHSFDGILDPDIVWRFGRIVNAWYRKHQPDWRPEHDNVRRVLVWEMMHTVHICKNTIYSDYQGNPSGNPLTVILNTFAHKYYMMLAWIELARRECPEFMYLDDFDRNVRDIYYGDDGLYSVKFETSKWFNLETVSAVLAEHGIEYTDEQKSDKMYGVRDLRECTFLKNLFIKDVDCQFWKAAISEDTIYELTNWVRRSDDPILQLRENLRDALHFAYFRGRDFFDRFKLKVNEALERKRLQKMSSTYELEEEVFLSKCRN